MSLPLTFYVFSELANEAWICSTCFVVTAIRSLNTIHILFLWFLFFIPLTMVYNWNIFILSKTMKTYIHQWCLYSVFFFLYFWVLLLFSCFWSEILVFHSLVFWWYCHSHGSFDQVFWVFLYVDVYCLCLSLIWLSYAHFA